MSGTSKGFTMTNVEDELGKLMSHAADGLKHFQKGKIGQVPETSRQRAVMFKRLLNMPPSDRKAAMKDALVLSGHTNKEDNCDMCQFMAEQVARVSK